MRLRYFSSLAVLLSAVTVALLCLSSEKAQSTPPQEHGCGIECIEYSTDGTNAYYAYPNSANGYDVYLPNDARMYPIIVTGSFWASTGTWNISIKNTQNAGPTFISIRAATIDYNAARFELDINPGGAGWFNQNSVHSVRIWEADRNNNLAEIAGDTVVLFFED